MNRPTFLSLFSGAGGLDLGLHRAGWECIGQVERDPWRREILARHWPGVPRHDDVTTFDPEGIACDLICGGFPCQDVSLAGRRAGLAGERTGLFWDAMRIVAAVRPRFVLLENVVGLLSSRQRRDFPVVVGTLADLGYGVGWRVLDSQYFGVPQRRRRVFIVGALIAGRAGAERAGAILAVGSRCERHPAAGQEAGAGAAFRVEDGVGARRVGRTLTKASLVKGGHEDSTADYIVSTLQAAKGRGYRVDAESAAGGHLVPTVAHTLTSGGHSSGVSAPGRRKEDDVNLAPTGTAGVRRLTPVECCRLQGFPDDWFGEPNERPDAPRYAALGDAVTVPVAEWLGQRIAAAITDELAEAA